MTSTGRIVNGNLSWISPRVEAIVLPPGKMALSWNSLRRFQVSSARFIPESVKKYALRLRLTP